MSELLDWFNNPIPEPQQPDKKHNPCIALWGKGPEGKHCQDCSHMIGITRAKTYYKCNLRKNTHGSSTDHKLRWATCGRFEERTGPTPLYDGRN